MTAVKYPARQVMRALLRAQGRCINGPRVGNVSRTGLEHGAPVKGGKCQRCLDASQRLWRAWSERQAA